MAVLVGITTTQIPEAGVHRRPEIVLYSVYVRAVEAAGLTPVLLAPAHARRSLHALLGICQGLVLSGGEDVDPHGYGEERSPLLKRINPDRDAMEFVALERALELDLPILGICRGMQLMNVYFGGTLYQDLDAQRPGEVRHVQKEAWGRRTHLARAEPGSRLAALIGEEELLINSFHHQGIKDLAPELTVAAAAADGLIEAVEAPWRSWVVGVQWHPERHEATAQEVDPDRRLLAGFAEVVRRRAEGAP